MALARTAATQQTEVRFIYDDDALYIGARMFDDKGAAGVHTRLSRRDRVESGDYLQFVFDTYHDHSGRTMFLVNPSGVKQDAGQALHLRRGQCWVTPSCVPFGNRARWLSILVSTTLSTTV